MTRIHWIGILLIGCMAISGCEHAQSQTAGQAQPTPPPKVDYTMPQVKQVTDYEDFTGHTDAINNVGVRAHVTGYLIKVNFEDGAPVKEGDVLFEIDDQIPRADLENKKAIVVQNQRHSERLKSDYERAQKMLASRAISQEQYDEYRFNYIEALATLDAAEAARKSSQTIVDYTKVKALISGRV